MAKSDEKGSSVRTTRKPLVERLNATFATPSFPSRKIGFALPGGYQWHRLIKPIGKKLADAAAEAEKRWIKHEWQRANPGKRYPSKEWISSWESFADKGEELIYTKKPMIRSSLSMYEFALFVANEVCIRAEDHGFSVKTDQQSTCIELHRAKAKVQVRVFERMRAETRKRAGAAAEYRSAEQIKHATGRVELRISHWGSTEAALEVRWEVSFDEQWQSIIDLIEKRYARAVDREEKWEVQRAEYAEEESRRFEEARRQQRLRDEAAAEQKRREELLVEAAHYDRARLLRRFLDDLDVRQLSGGEPCADYADWRAWAETVANDLDTKRVKKPDPNCAD